MAKPKPFATPEQVSSYKAGASIRELAAQYGKHYGVMRRSLINSGVELARQGGRRKQAA